MAGEQQHVLRWPRFYNEWHWEKTHRPTTKLQDNYLCKQAHSQTSKPNTACQCAGSHWHSGPWLICLLPLSLLLPTGMEARDEVLGGQFCRWPAASPPVHLLASPLALLHTAHVPALSSHAYQSTCPPAYQLTCPQSTYLSVCPLTSPPACLPAAHLGRHSHLGRSVMCACVCTQHRI